MNNFNNEVRLTLDPNIRCVRRDTWVHTLQTEDAFVCTEDVVVLELKLTRRFPYWYRDLVEAFNLPQCGAAKDVEGTPSSTAATGLRSTSCAEWSSKKQHRQSKSGRRRSFKDKLAPRGGIEP